MSSNKRLCLRSETKTRQSFSERFCDDLSEVILQYLSLEDQLRLEFVSKQFQRTILKRENILRIDFPPFIARPKYIELILQKCPNIKTIRCLFELFRFSAYQRTADLFEAITKYCHNVKDLHCNLFCDQNTWNQLIKTIDSNDFTLFKSVDPRNENTMTYILKSLAFVKKLRINSWHSFSLSQLISLKNLNKVWFHFSPKDFNDLQTLIENNKSLEYIEITAFDCNDKQFNQLFDQISELKDLIELKITSQTVLNSKSLTQSLKQMALKCLKLKSISFDLRKDSNNSIMDLISSLKVFEGLKRLEISVPIESKCDNNSMFSFKAFEDFKQLSHLSLTTNFGITNDMFTDIEVFLPKLNHLGIYPLIYVQPSTPDILSRLSVLQSINIVVNNQLIGQTIEDKLKQNCRKISKIRIDVNECESPYDSSEESLTDDDVEEDDQNDDSESN